MLTTLRWSDFLPTLRTLPDASLDFLILMSGAVPEAERQQREWLDESVRVLRPGGLLFLQGLPEELPSMGVYLDGCLTFKYWIAIESQPRSRGHGLPSVHAALLLFAKGAKFNVRRVRFPHEQCRACARPLRDWGGKSHLRHPDGFAISDVWKSLPLADNYRRLSPAVLRTIFELLPDSPTKLAGILAPEEGTSLAEPPSRYEVHALQLPLPGFVPSSKRVEPQPLESLGAQAEGQLWDVVIQGDALEVLKRYPDESVDLVFADPPYNLDKKYNSYEDEKGDRAYLEWCQAWLDEYIRILKPNGSLYLLNLPRWAMHLADYLNRRLFFQNWIVWDALSEPRGKIMPAHYALLFYTRHPTNFTFNYEEVARLDARFYCLRSSCVRQRKARGDDEKEFLSDIWWDIHRLKHRRHRDYHPCQLPEGLLERIIRLSSNPGDVILDALAGTGTTAVVAARLGRRYVAIDVDNMYVQIMRQKLAQLETLGSLFRSPVHRPRRGYSKKALQLELQRIARVLGRLPTPEDVQKLSRYDVDTFLQAFPTWGKALRAAKLEVTDERS